MNFPVEWRRRHGESGEWPAAIALARFVYNSALGATCTRNCTLRTVLIGCTFVVRAVAALAPSARVIKINRRRQIASCEVARNKSAPPAQPPGATQPLTALKLRLVLGQLL